MSGMEQPSYDRCQPRACTHPNGKPVMAGLHYTPFPIPYFGSKNKLLLVFVFFYLVIIYRYTLTTKKNALRRGKKLPKA